MSQIMDKFEKVHMKMFDGDDFTIWRYQMEIIFEAKEILEIVDDTLSKPLHLPTAILIVEQKEELWIWNLDNAKAWMLIS